VGRWSLYFSNWEKSSTFTYTNFRNAVCLGATTLNSEQ
jgi:hypothetical protein